MALTLDSTLQTRLDSLERQPEIEVLSSEFLKSVPFQGNSFGIAGSDSFNPQLLSHSSGRLVQVYINSAGQLQLMYTDVDRNQWTEYSLAGMVTGPDSVDYVSLVELPDGNVGLIIIRNSWPSTKVLQYATIQVTGEVVTAFITIESLSGSYSWTSPYITQLDSGVFYLVYIRKDTSTPAYAIYARTANTWGSFGSASDITPSGVNTSAEIENPSLFETGVGDLFLLFDHVTSTQDDITIKNIFSSISTNDGATWGTASARTNYTQFGDNGIDPIMVQKNNGTVWLIFYENKRVLHLDKTATGFVSCSNCNTWSNGEMGVKDLHLDSTNQKLYVTYGNSVAVGNKCIGGVAVVDKATWSIDKIYYAGSTPALNAIFCNTHVTDYSHIHGEGKYLALSITAGGGHTVVAIIDHTADSITHYMIDDLSIDGITDGLPAWNLPRNVSHNSNAKYGSIGVSLRCVRVDESRDRVYMGWTQGNVSWGASILFSYIDLTSTPDGEGFYNMTWVTSETSGINWPNMMRFQYELGWQFEIDNDRGYIISYHPGYGPPYQDWYGAVIVMSEAADCAIVKQIDVTTNNSAPFWAVTQGVLYNGALYGNLIYKSAYPYTDRRGLCKIDYVTDTITYYRPTFATADNYGLRDGVVDEVNGRIYWACSYGIARFDIVSGAWTIFNKETMPGFVENNEYDGMFHVEYDPVNGDVIGGAPRAYGINYASGINMFNENGAYNQLQYITADKTTVWNWGNQLDLSYYSTEDKPSAVITQDDTLWVTWNHIDYDAGQNVLHWDNDLGDIGVINDLIDSVVLNWQLKKVNTLNFKLANGHLYDPQNLLSTKNVVGQKGRKVHVRIGEKIGGYVYWVNQGTFIVDQTKMSYTRGRHPVLSLTCNGKTSLWRQQQVAVTNLYSGTTPDDVIADIIQDHTQWLSTDYLLPEINNEHNIYYQWIDKTIWDIIEELLDHFFYAMYEDVDGVFTYREVSLTQAVDHEYSDEMQLVNFSPDDNYSNYTNRVRVIGESNDYMEVLHAEELITSRSGTIGWWAKEDTEKIYYSEDESRQCRNPRLNVTHSPKEYGLLLDMLASGDGGIEISYVDPYERFIRVTIKVKDLTAAFVGAVIAMLASAYASWGCLYCGPFIIALAISASLVMYILAAMAQYAYEVYARPLGRVKTTIQYEANDIQFQQKLNGEIVTEEITDALCNTVAECRRVAEGNLEMIAAQRRRVNFKKLAHLQDELLDKLKVYHPYSNEAMEILVVGLKRTYTKGQNVIDDMEAWRYIP